MSETCHWFVNLYFLWNITFALKCINLLDVHIYTQRVVNNILLTCVKYNVSDNNSQLSFIALTIRSVLKHSIFVSMLDYLIFVFTFTVCNKDPVEVYRNIGITIYLRPIRTISLKTCPLMKCGLGIKCNMILILFCFFLGKIET